MSYRHEVTEIAPRTWCLSEFRLVNAFLIEGEERAALVDTGCGIGDLAREVRELTDKPLIILLTHTHFDHDGGIYEFPGVPVYVNPLDGERIAEDRVNMVKYMGTEDYNEMRRGYIRSRGPIRCPDLDQAELLKLVPDHPTNDGYSWLPVRDGNEIDLGVESDPHPRPYGRKHLLPGCGKPDPVQRGLCQYFHHPDTSAGK